MIMKKCVTCAINPNYKEYSIHKSLYLGMYQTNDKAVKSVTHLTSFASYDQPNFTSSESELSDGCIFSFDIYSKLKTADGHLFLHNKMRKNGICLHKKMRNNGNVVDDIFVPTLWRYKYKKVH